jgi:hypothetical protein
MPSPASPETWPDEDDDGWEDMLAVALGMEWPDGRRIETLPDISQWPG